MKRIKTIIRNTNGVEEFDAEVNKAIAEGWTLVKREVLRPYEGPTRLFFRMLYAELERQTVELVPHDCQTCKWVNSDSHREPCRSCSDGENWVPQV